MLKLKCQDRAAYKEKESRQAIAMVDGAGQTNWNPIAGERIANLVTEFMIEHFEDILYETKTYVGRILMKQIYDCIFIMMNHYDQPAKEFNFTILGACIDHGKGTYCTIHLGDGVIVSGGKNRRVISYPYNGKNENETCLVLSDQALRNLKFHSGNADEIQYLALCTDGVYEKRDHMQVVFERVDDLYIKNKFSSRSDDSGIILLKRQ